ncbi:FG-GAP repeat domain-containing protein [Candidatus Altiarchaeota archaeon]
MFSSKRAFQLTAIITLASMVCAQDIGILREAWSHEIGFSLKDKPDIFDLYIADINGDSQPEISVITTGRTTGGASAQRNRIYVYRGDGTPYWEYGIDHQIKAVIHYDIDNDGNIEHIVSSSEKREKIQRGSLKIIAWNGEHLRSLQTTASMESLAIGDVDSDRYYEIAYGSERAFLYRRSGEFVWMYPAKGDGILNQSISKIDFGDVDRDDHDDVIIGADTIYYITPYGELMGSFIVEEDTPYLKRGFKMLELVDLSPLKYDETLVVTLTNEIHAIKVVDIQKPEHSNLPKIRLEKSWSKYMSCDITKAMTVNLDGDDFPELLFGCSDHVLRAIDNNGVPLWDYIVDGGVADFIIADLNEDKVGDIIVATSKGTLYYLDTNGKFKWKYDTNEGIVKVGSADIDGDKVNDIILISQNSFVKAYVLNQTFNMRRKAETYFRVGRDNYLQGNYNVAEENLLNAKQIYSVLDDSRGLEDIEDLLSRLDDKKVDKRREEADLYYDKAQEAFINTEYKNALGFNKMAKTIYLGVGDSQNVLKCELMEIRIDSMMRGDHPIGNLPPSNATTTTLPVEESWLPDINYQVVSIVIFVAIVGLVLYMRRKEEAPTIGEEAPKGEDFWNVYENEKK